MGGTQPRAAQRPRGVLGVGGQRVAERPPSGSRASLQAEGPSHTAQTSLVHSAQGAGRAAARSTETLP